MGLIKGEIESGEDVNRNRAMLRLLAIRGATLIQRKGDRDRDGETLVECVCGRKHLLHFNQLEESPGHIFAEHGCDRCGGTEWYSVRVHSGGVFNARTVREGVLEEWLDEKLDGPQRWSWPL